MAHAGKFTRSVGLELGGLRSERTSLAVIDYFPDSGRLVLTEIDEHIRAQDKSPDQELVDTVRGYTKGPHNCAGVAVPIPTGFPPLFSTEKKKFAFPEDSDNKQVRWMQQAMKGIKPKPKYMSPYLQRPCEFWLRHLTHEKFEVAECMGAQNAPLAARLQFVGPHFEAPLIEVSPHASLSRLVTSLGLPKSLFREYKDFDEGIDKREAFFEELARRLPQMFFYDRDVDKMVENLPCFHAFLSAFTLHLMTKGQCEVPPKNFPRGADWIYIPLQRVDWASVF